MVLAVLALAMSAPASAETTPAGSNFTLVFNDEFSGTSVDTTKWNYRTDVKGWSAQRPENVTVGNGAMTINLRKEAYAGKEYTGGGLISKNTYRYGYYETRAKTNVGSGWHSAFWAMLGNGDTFNPDRRTEIDGFEIDSHVPRNIRHNVHKWNADGSSAGVLTSGNYDVGFDTSAAWHTYGFDWNENVVRYYVDGALRYTANYPPESHQHDYLNVWLSAIAIDLQGSPGVDDSKLPGTVQFDYFRYYIKDHYVDNDTPASYGYSETGTWATSSLPGFTKETTSRYTNAAGATATWRPNLRAAGTYAVYVYKIVSSGNDTASRIDVVHNGTTSTSTVDYSAGSTDWVHVGTWYFPAGTSGYVKLTRGNGNARADAVKFLPQT